MVDFASIGKIIGGLGGLFGKKGHDAGGNASLSVRGQAHGARMGADEYGFNPLTLLQYGQVGAMSDRSGAPPLASVQLLTEGLQGIYEEKTGVAAQRREREKLELDRAKIELERLKAGSTYAVVSPHRVVNGSPLGPSQVEVRQSNTRTIQPKMTPSGPFRITPAQSEPFMAPNNIAPGREKKADPLTNSPGVFEIENAGTGGPVTIPGDSEPWGVDELLTAVTLGAPQVSFNWGKRLGEKIDEWRFGKPLFKSGGQKFQIQPKAPPPRKGYQTPYLDKNRQLKYK